MDDIKLRTRGSQNRQPLFVPPRQSVPFRPRPRTPIPPKPMPAQPLDKERFVPKSQPFTETKKPPKSGRHKRVIILAILLLLAIGGAVYWWVVRPRLQKPPAPVASNQPAPAQTAQPEKLSGTFRIVATGDIITHDSVTQNARTASGGYDYAPMLTELKPFLENAQTRICHDTVPAAGGALSGYPSFNAPTELIGSLAGSGCNVMSLASDHIGDKGQAAIDSTVQTIEANKQIVISAGANRSAEERAKDRYFNAGDGQVKFAYFSYTNRQAKPSATPFGVNVYDKNTAAEDIKKVRETVDFVLVSMCWGKEDSGDIQPDQDVIAQELADAGADVVFGHCTHIVQPVKQIKATDSSHNTVVYYSLGNALNSQLPIDTLVGGMAVVDIDLANKKVISAGFLPTYMHYEWTPAQKAAKDLNARKNFKLYPLDKAEAPLASLGNGTTVAAQTQRIKEITNRFTVTKILASTDLNKAQ